MLAADYPFLNVLWTMLCFFALVCWFWLLIMVFADIFSRHDMSGWKKAAWVVGCIVLPFVGVLAYLGVHADDMAERRDREVAAQRAQVDEHIRTVAGSGGNGGATAQIEQAKRLLDSGTIDKNEFDQLKRKALAV
jgi:hypothetical protein